MKKRIKSHLTAGAFAMTLLSQSVHAEIDPKLLSNTVDVLTAIRAIANEVNTTTKSSSGLLSPTAEQRAVIINAIARGAVDDSEAIQQMIVNAQSPIQSVLESTSCAEDNRIISAIAPPFPSRPSFLNSAPLIIQRTIVSRCADAVLVDHWKMPTPEALEFTAMFRPAQSEQVNTWRFKIKRQVSGTWELDSLENITSAN
jgi:hypothetical protein